MSGWDPERLPEPRTFGLKDYLRFSVTWLQMAIVIYGFLLLLWIVRAFEWPFGRPVTPAIASFACRTSLRVIGLRLKVTGTPMQAPGAVVANHVSWLDILVMHSCQEIYFVAKAEVKKWFGIGILARATNAIFIKRHALDARRQTDEFTGRFLRGDTLLFFPEGTSTDGMQVLTFKPTLFAAMFHEHLRDHLFVQPVTANYRAPPGQDPRFYGFWGTIGFGEHLLRVLSVSEPGEVELIYHEPVPVSQFSDRKQLASYCEQVVRSGMHM